MLLLFEWYCFLLFIIGIFYVEGPLVPSHIINTTFQNIYSLYKYTCGSVLCVNTSSYINLTLERCIFSSCYSYYGRALYLSPSSPFINIIRCRFENNYASYDLFDCGYDIYVDTSSCFSETEIITDSCTTSTSTSSVYCYDSSKTLFTTCEDKIVLLHILFFLNICWCYK
jgi:hypothetical protein